MLSEKNEAQEIIKQVNSADSNNKIDMLISRTNPHLGKVSQSEQPGDGMKSIFITMMDHSCISLRLHKGQKPEPTSITIFGFTDGQHPQETTIELPASGPELAQDALDRVYESCRQNLNERHHFLTFQPTAAQLEYLARVEKPTVSVIARLTHRQYWAMPGVHSVQKEMASRMKAMLEWYNAENPDSKYRGIQNPYRFTMEQIACVLKVIKECQFSCRESSPQGKETPLTEIMRMWSLRPQDAFTTTKMRSANYRTRETSGATAEGREDG